MDIIEIDTLKIERLDRVMKVKQTRWDGVKCKALGVDERVHLCFVAVAQVPHAQGISSVQQDRTRNMAYYQSDVPGSTGDPDFPGTGMDEVIMTHVYLENGHCCGIVREQVDQLVCHSRCPQS